jgi:hypothetical protein
MCCVGGEKPDRAQTGSTPNRTSEWHAVGFADEDTTTPDDAEPEPTSAHAPSAMAQPVRQAVATTRILSARGDGFYIFDAFESEDAVERFRAALGTISEQVGIEEPPKFFPAHRIYLA